MVDPLFYPKSVVVFGVSETQDNLGRKIVENLIEFQFGGELFLVGRKEGTLFGKRILTSLEDIPEGVDIAVILTPAHTVPGILESCGQKKIHWAIVETGGFSEYSSEGLKLEEEVLRIARKWDIRICGPNCIGVINPESGFVVPFVNMTKRPTPPGKVSILAQSGGISFTYFNLLSSANVGIAKMVSMGNKVDLDEIDYLRHLVRDPKTEMIGLYLESIEKGKELLEIARGTSKPIILHKANTGEQSRKIAKLHTAALANDDEIVDQALRQAGIVRVRDFRSFVNAVRILSLPPMKGNNLVVISRSGGIAIVAADTAETNGFRLYPLSRAIQNRIHGYFRAKVIRPTNPIDLGDLFDFELYVKILEDILKMKAVDGILFQHGAVSEEREPSRRLIGALKELSFRYEKPVALCYLTDEEELAHIKKVIDYPIFSEPHEALSALAISRDHYRRRIARKGKPPSMEVDRDQVRGVLERAKGEKRDPLLPEAFEVLEAYGIRAAKHQVVHLKRDLKEAVGKMGNLLAMKIVSSSLSHKSDVGGVILNIGNLQAAEKAYGKLKRLSRGESSAVLVQKMVQGGKEIILGAKRDPSFGPVILLGLGGIYVEVLRDISLRVAPISRSDGEEMISGLKGAALLKGVRGERAVDSDAIVENILRLSQLMIDFPEIEGIDINPIIAMEKGALAVDARIILSRPAKNKSQ